ncbi:MAG: hypothetical protein ABFD82_17350 [Syntrophaceae bacterium]
MEHTFLFQEGYWNAKGHYFDDTDRPLPLVGTTRITHLDGLWINEGEMEINTGDQSIKIYNRYEIVPFREGKNQTTWKSLNPDLGTLLGRFVIVDDTILSTCSTKSGGYTGTEFFLRVTETHYKNRGVLFKENDILSSWSVDLRKQSSL